jgi:hypothetical protein
MTKLQNTAAAGSQNCYGNHVSLKDECVEDLSGAETAQTAWTPRLRRSQAVEYLRVVHGIPTTVATLAKLACVGGGPPFQKMGRVVLYPRVELDRWAEGRISVLKRNTSERETSGVGGIGHV